MCACVRVCVCGGIPVCKMKRKREVILNYTIIYHYCENEQYRSIEKKVSLYKLLTSLNHLSVLATVKFYSACLWPPRIFCRYNSLYIFFLYIFKKQKWDYTVYIVLKFVFWMQQYFITILLSTCIQIEPPHCFLNLVFH